LLALVAQKEGIKPEQVVLLNAGKAISEAADHKKKLVDLGIADRATLFMAVRLAGGAQ